MALFVRGPCWGRLAWGGLALLGVSGTAEEPVMSDSEPFSLGQPLGAAAEVAPVALPLASMGPIEDGEPTCALPPTPVEASHGCADGGRYPECKWRLPSPEEALGTFAWWRHTDPSQRWGHPVLVQLLLRVAAAYAERFPGEHLVVGDLDAPGPRHQTHDQGRDVDLYLPGVMMSENLDGGPVKDNYRERSADRVRENRLRVLGLAKALATCAGGQLRIYYNDPVVVREYNQWYRDAGLSAPFDAPMLSHNDLHGFHFHVTLLLPEDAGHPAAQ